MNNYIESLNNQRPYLTHNQPTEETVKVIETLYKFFSGTFNHSNFRYQNKLLACNLDYSLNSIKRIDGFLNQLRIKYPDYNQEDIFKPSYPLNKDITLHVLAYYLGELLGRVRQQVPIWHSNYYQKELSKKINSFPFEVFFAEYLNPEVSSEIIFEPMHLIYRALSTAEPSTDNNPSNIWDSIQAYIPSEVIETTDFDVPLEPMPVMELQFDRQLAFEQLDKFDLAYLQVMPPSWMKDDSLYNQLEQLDNLYKNGKVVWAHIVQANTILFTNEEAYSCPAEIIYDSTGRTPPSHLEVIAHKLFSLKNTTPDDSNLIEYAEHITNEKTRIVGNTVPDVITSLPLKTSTIFIWRLHLPNGLLQSAIPILISENTEEVTLLPAKFWDKQYYERWFENSYFKEDMYYSLRALYISKNPWKTIDSNLLPTTKQLNEICHQPPNLVQSFDYHVDLENSFAVRSFYRHTNEQEGDVDYSKIVIGVIIFIVILKLIYYFTA